MVESHLKREEVAQSCLSQARRLPEARGLEAKRLISMYIDVDQGESTLAGEAQYK